MSSLSNDIDPNARIAEFLVDYVHDIDDDNLEAWPDYFTEDAIYQIIPRENFENDLPLGLLYCEGRGMMLDRIDALRTANIFEPHTHCHTLNPPRIRASGNGLYTARTNFTVIRTKQDGAMDVFAVGKYVDEIILVGDRPLFRDRRVVIESHRVDILLVKPL